MMFIGRLDRVKAVDRLIEAMALLANESIVLHVYGGGPQAYVDSLKQLAKSRGIGARVQFHGHVEDDAKRRAFAEADVSILPSFSENFGMVVAESLAHGVPVIVSKGVPWAEVEARGCGRWVDNAPDALARAIVDMGDADLEAMGAVGRNWMEAEFGWDRVAARTLAAMRTLNA